MKDEQLKRKFSVDKTNLNDNEILNYITTKPSLYVVLASPGMGKSYLAKKWSKDSLFKRFEAQTVSNNDIKDKVIIDNLDEVPIEKAKKIIKWITIKQKLIEINKGKKMSLIIFTRPETFEGNKLFEEITFTNEKDIIPRYKYDFKISSNDYSYTNLEKHFSQVLKEDSNEYDFLSILAFKMLSSGVIHMNKYDLKEFVRKYNVNNITQISIEKLIAKKIFRQILNKSDDVYFMSKTIPSFFVIAFLKKFAHIKNSYLVKFKNFVSQVNFSETSQIIEKMKDKLELSWKLVKNNDFFFIFLKSRMESMGLDNIFTYGSEITGIDEFTRIIARTQIVCCNDEDFNGSIYFNLNLKVLEKINFELYFKLIKNGIKQRESKYYALASFLSNFKHVCMKNLSIYNKNIDYIKSLKIEHYICEEIKNNKYFPLLYVLDLIEINKIHKIMFNNYSGPLETALAFAISFDKNKAYKLLNYFKWEISHMDFYANKSNAHHFINFLIKNKDVNLIDLIKFWKSINLNANINSQILKKIDTKKVAEATKKWRDFNYTYSKILIKEEDMNRLKKFIGESFINRIFRIEEKTKKDKNGGPPSTYSLRNIEHDIEKLITELDFEIIEKYLEGTQYDSKLKDFEIIEKENFEKFNSNIYELLDKRINNKNEKIHLAYLKKIISFVFQVIFKLDKKFINNTELNPVIILISTNINYDNALDQSNYEWYENIDIRSAKKNIINYFKNIVNLNYFLFCNYDSILIDYMEEILTHHDQNNVEKTLKFLAKKPDTWYELLTNRPEKYDFIKESLKKMTWKPKNLIEIVTEPSKLNSWLEINTTNDCFFKEKIQDLFKNTPSYIGSEHSSFYSRSWFDDFFDFFEVESNRIIRMTIDFLHKYKLTNFFIDELIGFSNKLLAGNNELNWFIYNLCDWIIALGSISNKTDKNKIIQEILSSNKNRKNTIEIAWHYKTKELLNYKNKSTFNISNYYRYLNDELDISEFKSLFIREIVPKIKSIKERLEKDGLDKFETRMQKEIQENLAKSLLNKYGILVQHESNTYNTKNNKRIDFILSKKDKYIFMEIKSSKDPRINNEEVISRQLQDYKDSYNLISNRFLVLLKIHNIKASTIQKLEEAAIANDFELIVIENDQVK